MTSTITEYNTKSTGNNNMIMYPTDTDIICGRGRGLINHPGNQMFIETLRQNIPLYERAKKRTDKSLLVASIVETLKQDHGVRFLKKVSVKKEEQEETINNCNSDIDDNVEKKNNNNTVCYCYYIELERDEARGKTGHAIRDLIKNDQKQQQAKKNKKNDNKKQQQRTTTKIMIKEDSKNGIASDIESFEATTPEESFSMDQQPSDNTIVSIDNDDNDEKNNKENDPYPSLMELMQQPLQNLRVSYTGVLPPLPPSLFQSLDSTTTDENSFDRDDQDGIVDGSRSVQNVMSEMESSFHHQSQEGKEKESVPQQHQRDHRRRWSSAVLDLVNDSSFSSMFENIDSHCGNIDDDENSPFSLHDAILDDADILERNILLDSCLFRYTSAGGSFTGSSQ